MVDTLVEETASRGMYCLIDWHMLHPGDPWFNIEHARAFFAYMALRDAAQEGALYGSIHPADNTPIENRVRTSSNRPVDLWNTTNVHVFITKDDVCGNGVNGINVRVTYDFPVITPFLGAIIGSQTFPLGADITDTILAPPCSSP